VPPIDPDTTNPKVVSELAKLYEASAARFRKAVLDPPGKTPGAVAFNQARASQLLAQVNDEVATLKHQATTWTSKALHSAVVKGVEEADKQAHSAGVAPLPPIDSPNGSFAILDRRAVTLLARDTVGDLFKAADSLQRQMGSVLRHMQATGVTNAEVNRILAGGIIEGKPAAAIAQLKDALEKIHGETVTIETKSGPRNYETGYYARLVANSKMQEATMRGRHERLADHGLDLVWIDGTTTLSPCTHLLGRWFSLSGESKKYPAFETIYPTCPPYFFRHPNCHKYTVPVVESLASDKAKAKALGDGERHQKGAA